MTHTHRTAGETPDQLTMPKPFFRKLALRRQDADTNGHRSRSDSVSITTPPPLIKPEAKEKAAQRTPTKKRTIGKDGAQDDEETIDTLDVEEEEEDEDQPKKVIEAKADERKKIDQKISSAILGYARIDMADPEVKMTFGKFNPRPYDAREVSKLVDSFKAEGVKRWDLEHAIPIGLSSGILSTSRLNKKMPSDPQQLPELRSLIQHDLYELEPYGGQHRYYAIRKLVQETEKWLKKSNTMIERKITVLEQAQTKARESNDAAEAPALQKIVRVHKLELAALKTEKAEKEEEMRYRGQWLVVVYDTEKMTGGAVTALSRNAYLHQFKETVEEWTTNFMRDLYTYPEGSKRDSFKAQKKAQASTRKMPGLVHLWSHDHAFAMLDRIWKYYHYYRLLPGFKIRSLVSLVGPWGAMYCHIATRMFDVQDGLVRKTSVRTVADVRAELAHINMLKKNPQMASEAVNAEQALYDWAIGDTDGGGVGGRTYNRFLTAELMATIDTQYQQHRGEDVWVMLGQKDPEWEGFMAGYADSVAEAVRLHTEQVLLKDQRRRQESGLFDEEEDEEEELEGEQQTEEVNDADDGGNGDEDASGGVVQLLTRDEKEMIQGMAARAYVLLTLTNPRKPCTLVPLLTRQASIDIKQILTWNEIGWAEAGYVLIAAWISPLVAYTNSLLKNGITVDTTDAVRRTILINHLTGIDIKDRKRVAEALFDVLWEEQRDLVWPITLALAPAPISSTALPYRITNRAAFLSLRNGYEYDSSITPTSLLQRMWEEREEAKRKKAAAGESKRKGKAPAALDTKKYKESIWVNILPFKDELRAGLAESGHKTFQALWESQPVDEESRLRAVLRQIQSGTIPRDWNSLTPAARMVLLTGVDWTEFTSALTDQTTVMLCAGLWEYYALGYRHKLLELPTIRKARARIAAVISSGRQLQAKLHHGKVVKPKYEYPDAFLTATRNHKGTHDHPAQPTTVPGWHKMLLLIARQTYGQNELKALISRIESSPLSQITPDSVYELTTSKPFAAIAPEVSWATTMLATTLSMNFRRNVYLTFEQGTKYPVGPSASYLEHVPLKRRPVEPIGIVDRRGKLLTETDGVLDLKTIVQQYENDLRDQQGLPILTHKESETALTGDAHQTPLARVHSENDESGKDKPVVSPSGGDPTSDVAKRHGDDDDDIVNERDTQSSSPIPLSGHHPATDRPPQLPAKSFARPKARQVIPSTAQVTTTPAQDTMEVDDPDTVHTHNMEVDSTNDPTQPVGINQATPNLVDDAGQSRKRARGESSASSQMSPESKATRQGRHKRPMLDDEPLG
ncbi:hypothetical protein BDW22DRAFT_1347087 [Trametopsis cervina]|nr:hypothetical protein BDW22DRAFT_1347087 [Trametopsis cervina]